MDKELRDRIDALERELADAFAQILEVNKRLETLLTGGTPRTGTLSYMSGRWKRRDGTMYGR